MSLRLVAFALVFVVVVASWVATCSAWQLDRVAEGVVPLDPRHFERMTVVTAGTGGAYENPARRGPATVVALGEDVALVDAGRAVAEALRAARIPVSQPAVVLLTSLLPENTVGLDDLLLTGWLEGRSQPLRVLGPPGTRALVEALTASHRRGIEAWSESLALPPAGAEAAVEEVAAGWEGRLGEIALRAGDLPGGPLGARAYRFENAGRSVVVGGAGWAPKALADFARGAHLLVHEAVFAPGPRLVQQMGLEESVGARMQREAALHTALHDVGRLARSAGVETLALVRLRPPPVYDFQITSVVGEDFDGRVVIPSDGDELTP